MLLMGFSTPSTGKACGASPLTLAYARNLTIPPRGPSIRRRVYQPTDPAMKKQRTTIGAQRPLTGE